MKSFVLWYFIGSILLNDLSSADHRSTLIKRSKLTEETSTQLGFGSKDKESLQEALQLLNMGKQSLHLPTEDTQLLMQLADASNDTDKSDQIQEFVEDPTDDRSSSNEKQYLALSGEEGQVHVDNFSAVTPEPVSANPKGDDIQDIFRMVVQKKDPGSKDNAVHRITIVETNEVKPFSSMQDLQPRRSRRKRVWSPRDVYNLAHVRQKRTKDDPLLRFIRGDFSKNNIDDLFADKGTRNGGHTIKIRNLADENEFGERNNQIEERKYGDYDFRENSGNQFRGPYSPWTKPHRRWEPTQNRYILGDTFHTLRDASKYGKFRNPFRSLQSSSTADWWNSPKPEPRMDEGHENVVEDAIKIDNVFNEGRFKIPSHSLSTSRPQTYLRSETIEASSPKHTIKMRKFRIPPRSFQTSSPLDWWNPPKPESWMVDETHENVKDTVKTNDVFKANDYIISTHSDSTTKTQPYPQSKITEASSPKHSYIKREVSTEIPKSNSPTTKSSTTPKNAKTDPIQGVEVKRYTFQKSLKFPREYNVSKNKPASILEASTIVFIGLLCFAIIVLACSNVKRRNPPKSINTLELKGTHVTVNIHDEGFSDNLKKSQQLPFKSHSGTYYRRLGVQGEEDEEDEYDLPDLEWQSEMGEWLSDQGSVRKAIAFEKL